MRILCSWLEGLQKVSHQSHTVQPEDLLAFKFDTMASKWVDFTHISQCSSWMATMAAPHCGAILCRVSARYTSSSTVVQLFYILSMHFLKLPLNPFIGITYRSISYSYRPVPVMTTVVHVHSTMCYCMYIALCVTMTTVVHVHSTMCYYDDCGVGSFCSPHVSSVWLQCQEAET